MATGSLKLTRLLRPYWKLLVIAFAAMLVEAGMNLLEPWPLKAVFDYVLESRPLPAWLPHWFHGTDRLAVLNTAALAVVVIAVISAVSTYTQKYLSTTVAKRIG